MADSTNPVDAQDVGGNQVDKPSDWGVPYELQPGGHYLIEVKAWAMPRAEAYAITKYYFDMFHIDVQFVFTRGNEFALQAVPALGTDDALTDLQPSDPDTTLRPSKAHPKTPTNTHTSKGGLG